MAVNDFLTTDLLTQAEPACMNAEENHVPCWKFSTRAAEIEIG